MRVIPYAGLDASGLEGPLARVAEALARGDFRAAHVKKLAQGGIYRAELGYADRLLFQLRQHQGEPVALLLEVIRNHAYEKSRFLGGARIDEGRIAALESLAGEVLAELPRLPEQVRSFRMLDKVLVWDEVQDRAFRAPLPLLLIGSAGSGKTALVLERLKEEPGCLLYATLSPHLAEHARRLYHAHDWARGDQEVDFLCFREFLETLVVPEGREVTYRDFRAFFQRHARSFPELDAHRVHEEFKGVLTGFPVDAPFLPREAYLGLGVRQSIFPEALRPAVYDLFEKYLAYLKEQSLFEPNLVAHGHLAALEARYDVVAIDEVQDITNVQLALLLKALKKPDRFLLCGDSNQIVHPNFFSWAHLKTFFFERADFVTRDITRILATNYRNTPQVTDLANRLLCLKHRRFGSVDRESHFLVESALKTPGQVAFLQDTEAVRRELDAKTRESARCAVIVLRDEDKPAVAAAFRTPLLFSIHEAKGLEYENVILVGFAGGERKIFQEIAADLRAEDLDGPFDYRRAKDKGDKSLETYKFFVNSLYVGLTRAVKNIYWLEPDPQHPFLRLMGFGQTQQFQIAAQKSSTEEWEREARRLALQGKQEQAEAIERMVLKHHPVPWPVLDAAGLREAAEKALPPRAISTKLRERLRDWALASAEPMTLAALQAHGFPPPLQALQQRARVLMKTTVNARATHPKEFWREVDAHGLDHRTPLNLTPLMVAARAGRPELVEALLDRGADPELLDSRGWTAYHHALDEAWREPGFAREHLPRLHVLLAAPSLSLESNGRLLKFDRRQGEALLLDAFRVLLPWTMPLDNELGAWPGLTAPALAERLAQLPPTVVAEHRQKRTYLSSLLSRHERGRNAAGSRPLFRRTIRGVYALDPALKLRLGDGFHPIYDLLFPEPIRPYGPRGIRDFLEDPDAFVPPFLRYLEEKRARKEQEEAELQARREAELAEWRASYGERLAAWEAQRKAEREARAAAKREREQQRRKREEAQARAAQAPPAVGLFPEEG